MYLGNGWVLTANHVGAGTITFDSGTFFFDGNAVQLRNGDGNGNDLLLFHLTETPALPTLTISASTPVFGTSVEYVGYGRNQGEATTVGTKAGFLWSANRVKSWGRNRVATGALVSAINTLAFGSSFDSNLEPNEAMATKGDSGSGAFVQTLGGWELAGLTNAIYSDPFAGRPGNSAFYGDATFSADLASYRDQILTITGIPEPGVLALGGVLLPLWGLWARPRRKH